MKNEIKTALAEWSSHSGDYDPQEGESPIDTAARWLREDGIVNMLSDNLSFADRAVLLCEAVNAAAKAIDDGYYWIKASLVSWVSELPEVISGWNTEKEVYYLFTKNAGTVSFHDPAGEITASGNWPHEWSGVTRQENALDVYAGDESLLTEMVLATTPEGI